MANYICSVVHEEFGALEVYETGNGARCYGMHEQIGQIPFQTKKAQDIIRGLVIAAGHGDKLSRKPTALETANHAPEFEPEFSEKLPEPQPGDKLESVTVSVADNMPEKTPEPMPEKPGVMKRVKRFFDFEDEA